jgi:hypothetical protein
MGIEGGVFGLNPYASLVTLFWNIDPIHGKSLVVITHSLHASIWFHVAIIIKIIL